MVDSSCIKTILLADDHDTIREITEQMLHCLGYNVVSCTNGIEVLEYISDPKHSIDLIFLDLIMPDMGGFECIKNVRKIDQNIPIILCSGYPNHKEIVQAMRAGAECFVEKPFELKKLAWAIHEGLNNAKHLSQ